MSYLQGLSGSIGNTPLIKIESLSKATGCEILGKAEFMNPGGSVKDRAALWMVEAAERSGELKAAAPLLRALQAIPVSASPMSATAEATRA